jgi:hypothetical protein
LQEVCVKRRGENCEQVEDAEAFLKAIGG